MKRRIGSRAVVAVATAGTIAVIAPAAPAAAAPAGPSSAVGIVLERSGGFTGGRDAFVVDRSTVGGRRPLRMAGSRQFLRLRGSYQPANSCCDRYFYRLTVSYRGGERRTVSAVQGAAAPRILWDVIGEVQRVGVRPLPAAPAA